jgi:predicted AAA+ superfamily ATPase
MKRLQESVIREDLEHKMVFLSGPRQVGKTTLAQSLKHQFSSFSYYNYDEGSDRKIILNKVWDRTSDLIVFDEIHKLKKWKTHLKGTYDTEGIPPRLLITGSARLDVYRRGGDSLAGRYFHHRLYPFSVRELKGQSPLQATAEALLRFGGFPEPFLGQSEKRAARWRKQHIERIVRVDIQDLDPVRDIQTLILLIDLLKERVGSPISYHSLALILEISPHTVKRWIHILQSMYVLFLVSPYSRNIGRALLKEPKVYFYDTGAVLGDEGVKLENLVANCLLKHLSFLEDSQGANTRLHYVRNKEKKEVDFLTVVNGKIQHLLEVKLADSSLSPSLPYFQAILSPAECMQLVLRLARTKTAKGIPICSAAEFLETLEA